MKTKLPPDLERLGNFDKYKDFTDEYLEQFIVSTEKYLKELKLDLEIQRKELGLRPLGIRLGDTIHINGSDYICMDYCGSWPVFRKLKKNGEYSKNIRHAFYWKDYTKGISKTPF